MIQYDILIIW